LRSPERHQPPLDGTDSHLDEEAAVVVCEPDPAPNIAQQNNHLMSERRILRFNSLRDSVTSSTRIGFSVHTGSRCSPRAARSGSESAARIAFRTIDRPLVWTCIASSLRVFSIGLLLRTPIPENVILSATAIVIGVLADTVSFTPFSAVSTYGGTKFQLLRPFRSIGALPGPRQRVGQRYVIQRCERTNQGWWSERLFAHGASWRQTPR
jgi:hypothetical protein